MKKNRIHIFQMGLYLTLISFSIFVGSIFRPFTIIDNNQSNLICHTDNHTYESTPNFIFAINNELDDFNDAKARKLCEYHIIRDYNQTYKTPSRKNYTFLPLLQEDSSWLNAFFAGAAVFLIGVKIIEGISHKKMHEVIDIKNVVLLFVAAIYVSSLYLLILQKPGNVLYCKKQAQTQLYNFTQAIKKNGAPENIEHNAYVDTALRKMYTRCLQVDSF